MTTTSSKSRARKPALRLIRKATFDKLPIHRQRVLLAQDALLRIKLRLLRPRKGSIVRAKEGWDLLSAPKLQCAINRERNCDACAKGALLTSWIGNFDSFSGKALNEIGAASVSIGMPVGLTTIFSQRLLSAIEEAFEHQSFSWNCGNLNATERLALYHAFPLNEPNRYVQSGDPDAIKSARPRLIAILKNLIKHEGKLVFKDEAGQQIVIE